MHNDYYLRVVTVPIQRHYGHLTHNPLIGSYKLPLSKYTCIGLVVGCSFQQEYDFSHVLSQKACWHTPHTSPIDHKYTSGDLSAANYEYIIVQCYVGSVSSKVHQPGIEPSDTRTLSLWVTN